MANIDWNGLLNAGLNIYSSMNTANKNQTAAQNYGTQTQFNPYNLSYGNAAVGFNGNNAYGQLSPQYQQIQQQLLGGAGGLLGGLGSTFQNGGINSQLQNASDQYNQDAPGVSTVNPGGQTSISTGMGDQFNNTAQGFLGGLGGFNPQDAASQYTNNLRAQAQPQNQNAATDLAQNLFNGGRLGSTGGANMFGQLMQAQNQQDLGFQVAGQQYGGQEQSRLAGLAQGFGQLGTGINQSYAQSNNQFQNDSFNRNLASNQNSFNQGNQRATQRFTNAMALFGAGQQNMQGQLGAGLGLLQGSQGLDQNLLQAIGLGGQLGSAQSSANQKAYAPGLDSTVAKNNTSGANTSSGINSIINGLGGASNIGSILSGLFGGSGGGGSASDFLGGYGGDFSNYGSSVPSTTGGGWMGGSGGGTPTDFLGGYGGDFSGYFNGAGGQAANGSNSSEITPATITQSKVGDGSTGAKGVAGGITDTTPGGLLGTAGNLANIYNGIDQGGVGGYLKAGSSAASLAGYNVPVMNYAGAIEQAAKGDVVGGAYNAAVTYAGPVAAFGAAIADHFNKGKDEDSARMEATKQGLMSKGWQYVYLPRTAGLMMAPDGNFYNTNDDYKDFSRAITMGNVEEAQGYMDKWLKSGLNTKFKDSDMGKKYAPQSQPTTADVEQPQQRKIM
jgi:hypothetical protein